MSALSTNDIIGLLLALLDELARRLDPDMATAVLREHRVRGVQRGRATPAARRAPHQLIPNCP
jgi:hypothetical protein